MQRLSSGVGLPLLQILFDSLGRLFVDLLTLRAIVAHLLPRHACFCLLADGAGAHFGPISFIGVAALHLTGSCIQAFTPLLLHVDLKAIQRLSQISIYRPVTHGAN